MNIKKFNILLTFASKIIHKSELSHLCFYQKRIYTESIGRSFNSLYLCQNLSVSQVKYSTSQLSTEKSTTEYLKAALKKLSIFMATLDYKTLYW